MGQKFPTPSPGSGARVFYETLLREKPDCEMAMVWCVEHGVALGGGENLYKRLLELRARKEKGGKK
jgi:hypothetical protein